MSPAAAALVACDCGSGVMAACMTGEAASPHRSINTQRGGGNENALWQPSKQDYFGNGTESRSHAKSDVYAFFLCIVDRFFNNN